jgi:nitrate/nitrite transporter NarK
LSGTAAAGGIALINSIGNLGGFAAPSIIGWGKSMTNSYVGSMLVLSIFALIAALMMFALRRKFTWDAGARHESHATSTA